MMMILKVPGPNSGALDVRGQMPPSGTRRHLEAGRGGGLTAQSHQAPPAPLEGRRPLVNPGDGFVPLSEYPRILPAKG